MSEDPRETGSEPSRPPTDEEFRKGTEEMDADLDELQRMREAWDRFMLRAFPGRIGRRGRARDKR